MSLTAPAQGITRYPSVTSFWQRGTSPNEIHYALGAQNQTAFTTVSHTAGSLRARSFTVSRTVTIDRLSLEATAVVANAVGRCGIYTSTSLTNEYPDALVVDAGEVALATAVVRSQTVAVTLAPGLYWVAVLCGTANPTLRALAAASVSNMLGSPSTIATLNLNLTVALAYQALPATFPASAAVATTAPALVGARFSS